jgi:hypothetical protein
MLSLGGGHRLRDGLRRLDVTAAALESAPHRLHPRPANLGIVSGPGAETKAGVAVT